MNNIFRRIAMCLTVVTVVLYLGYRAWSTLNFAGPFAVLFSLILYTAELYGAGLLFLYFFNIWDLDEPVPVPPLPGRTVDVLIPTYNEDPELLRGTICAALAIEYPHRTYVLDDGRRPEVKQLAAELGANYISRDNNLHAKAGNLNFALDQTDGEFVVIFDADQLSAPNFISRLIGHFKDDRLAFVQTPHAFYNFDSFQARLNYKTARYWEEGELFYNLVQPGKNRWNAVMFCGSAAIFRRKALNDVGLIATETITEDMHTGLRLHAKGWKSLFVNERLICAQAAPDITAFHSQRLRWGEGNLGVFFYDNPLTMRGLNLAQRLSYLGSLLSWTTGFQKLILYMTPAVMLLTGVAPVKELTEVLVFMTLWYLAAIWIGVKIVSHGESRLFAEELYHMACFWTQCRSMYRAVTQHTRARFIVTSKRGRQSANVRSYIAPQMLYIALAVTAVAWAGTRYYFGLMHDVVGLVVGSTLLTVHALFAWVVVRRGLRDPDRRYSWRHPCAAHVEYQATTAEGTLTGQAVTLDLNERGAGLIVFQQLPKSALLRLAISAGGTRVEVSGRIRNERLLIDGQAGLHGKASAYRYGVLFEQPAPEQIAGLWRIGGGYAVSRQYERFNVRRQASGDDNRWRDGSAEARLPVSFDQEGEQPAVDPSVTEWISGNRFACLLSQRLGDDARRRFLIVTPFGPIAGEAAVGRVVEREIAGRTLYLHRFDFQQFEGQSRGVVQSVLQTANLRATRRVMAPIPGIQPTPFLKPLGAGLALAAMLAAVVFVVDTIVFRERIALVRVAEGDSTAPRDVALLDSYADRAAAGEITDRETLDVIIAGLYRLENQVKLNAIWDSPAANARMTAAERLSRAQLRAGTDHFAEAEEDFRLLLERVDQPEPAGLPPDLVPDLYLSAARNSYNSGDTGTAAKRYELAYRARPGDAQLAVEYAGILLPLDRVPDAIALLKKAPRDANGQHLLATAYVRESAYPAAVAIYREMLVRDPDNVSLHHELANVLEWSGDYASSEVIYQQLLEKSPDDRELKMQLARAWLAGHQYDEALNLLRSVLDESDTDPQVQQKFLDAAAAAKKLTPRDRRIALRILDKYAGDLARRPPEFAIRLADVLGRVHEVGKSIPVLQQLVDSDPANNEFRRRLADALSDAGRFDDAEVQYRELLARRRGQDRKGAADTRRLAP
jgi:cellulose synthase/poly-beta-1,6-N-acetylglucosamine synthase-like glycosyltransferase/predicted Zn-dependent protease